MPGPGTLPRVPPWGPRASRDLGRAERVRAASTPPPGGPPGGLGTRLDPLVSATMSIVIEERLAELGLELPLAPQPIASYVPVKVVGDLAWVAGQVPMQDGAVIVSGSVGADVTAEEANVGARRCAIQALAALDASLGSLDRV